jgi:hypothetical protein
VEIWPGSVRSECLRGPSSFRVNGAGAMWPPRGCHVVAVRQQKDEARSRKRRGRCINE